jgi:hypothetical protein
VRFVTLIPSASLVLHACGGGDENDTTGPGGQTPAIPAARSGHAMVYDDARHVVLMFGGNGTATLGDLWSWDGVRWTRLATSGPPPRDDAVLVYDATRQRTVLFGGRSGQTLLNDTWEWDGTSWTRASIIGPADRGSNQMAYDRGRQRTMALLFHRLEPNADRTYASDLWEWTGTAWSALAGAGPTFSPVQPMVGLGASGGLLLFDGGVLQGTASTWVWQNAQWSRVATAGPSLRNGHALAYDATRNRVVLFGGFRPGQDFSDTWEWSGTSWTQITPP